jgi:hypothetical protein
MESNAKCFWFYCIFIGIIILVGSCGHVNALPQENKEKDKALLANGIYILPTQLIFPEILLTYEHFYNDKFSLSYSAGYKIPVGKGNTFKPFGSGLFAVYEFQYMFNKFSSAIYLSVAPSYFFDNNRRYFIQCEIFNRYYWLDKKQLSFDNVETARYNSVRSERNNVTGFKLLLGNNKNVSVSKSLFLSVKIYGGLGLRYKIYHYENINNRDVDMDGNETIYPYQEENGTMITPSFQLGLKLGLAKKKI